MLITRGAGQSECNKCGFGFFKGDSSRKPCQPCPPGEPQDKVHSAALSMSEQIVELLSLVPSCAGTYSDILGATACEDCSPGYHQEHSGAAGCDSCSVGTICR